MVCNDVQDLIPLYVAGNMSEVEREVVSKHVSNCLVCSLWLEDVRDLEDIWNQPTHPLPNAMFVSSVLEGLGVSAEASTTATRVATPSRPRLKQRRETWAKTTLYHYGIAASCTVALVHFGFFEGFGSHVEILNALFSAKVEGFLAYASQVLT